MRARLTRTRTRPLAPRSLPDQGPERIDRYVIQRRLGVGGMGVVYEALDERVGRSVALKLMLVGDAEVDRERMRREAQALARLSHPNVVEVFEIGEHHDPASGEPPRAYVAMELVDGHPLDRWLRLRRRGPAEIVQVFAQAGEGLAAAHAHGLVHRDFKPGNVLVGNDGRVRVVDFGLVRESDAIEPSSPSSPRSPTAERSAEALTQANWSESLTKTGAMVGTPAYMSPEQLTNLPVGPASDQFSFCVALYEALFGLHPFVVDGEWSKLPLNVLDGAINRPPAEPRVPGRLTKAVMRGLAVRPEDRWPSMDVLLPELRRALERRGPRPALAALTLGVAVIGLWAVAQSSEANVPDRCEEASATMHDAWGPQARDDLREAWLGTGRPSDADTWSRVDARMQTYAESWWEVHRAACAGAARSPSSATCLARLADGVHTRLKVMARPNDSLLDNAVQMISELPSVDLCRAALDAPPESSPEVLVEDEAPWRGELDRLDALEQAGQFDEAHRLIDALFSRAELEGSPALVAEVKLRAAHLHMHNGDYPSAAVVLEESYLEAKHLGRDRLAAEAALTLLQLFGERYYREDQANRWARHARAEAERVGDPRLTANVLNARGRARRGGDHLEEALELHQQALELQRSLPNVEDSDVAWSLFQIGSCLGLMDRVAEARPFLDQALALQEAVYGPQHPRVATTLINIGVFLMVEKKHEEALEIFERTFDIMQNWAPNNPGPSWVPLVNMSVIHQKEGRPDRAVEALRTYLHIVERSPIPESVAAGRVEWVRAEIAMHERHHDEAVALFERALRAEDLQSYDEARARAGLARALVEAGRFEEAAEVHRDALARLQSKDASALDVHDVISTEQSLAHTLGLLDDHPAALRELEQTRALYAERLEDPVYVADLDVGIGMELTALGRSAEALPTLRAAVRILESKSTDPAGVMLVYGLIALAEAELATGDRAAALEHAERAVSVIGTPPSEPPEHVVRAWFVLAQSLGASREERTRAQSLARQAEERWAARGKGSSHDLEKVRAWLEAQR